MCFLLYLFIQVGNQSKYPPMHLWQELMGAEDVPLILAVDRDVFVGSDCRVLKGPGM